MNFPEFVKYIRIKDKSSNKEIPLTLNKAQLNLINFLEENKNNPIIKLHLRGRI
jgi:hypothetical protein